MLGRGKLESGLKDMPFEDKKPSSIFIDKAIGHMGSEYLTRLLQFSFQKLQYGLYPVAKMAYFQSYISVVYFNMDLRYPLPLRPETLSFLLEFIEVREVKKNCLCCQRRQGLKTVCKGWGGSYSY
ncbi:MAG: hypothetical protein QMD46_13845 [Methanomicrobiales archaeon]|nr:hypothetical protein [Methanomicrobiales archaeon]MDI6876917.1 hypothetical protein [Methanomicrobiales archaeon]